ncbi:MAG: rod shape-determining protein MreD [Chloroherpetonaceae bacterium]|nr:rod shape-determining protein MreD [Chloroherpetonaceae bacterium]
MTNPIVLYSIGFLFFALSQKFLVDKLALGGVRPDIILILLVFFARNEGQSAGTVVGFVVGLMTDLLYGTLGLSAFTKTIAGFVAGYFSNSEKRTNDLNFATAVFVTTFIHNVMFQVVGNFLMMPFWKMLLLQGVLGAFYTSVISYLLFSFVLRRYS